MGLKNLFSKKQSSNFESKIASTTTATKGRTYCYLMITLPILFFAMLYPPSSPAASTMYSCPNPSISIKTGESVDHRAICNSAEDALVFFSRLGIELPCQLVIEIAQNLPDGMSETAVGCYQKKDQRIFVLTFPEFEKRKLWFKVPINWFMYRSLVTHEVAHAVANCNFAISDPTYHAQEYLAYVAMFSMMNPVLRTSILEQISGPGFDSEFQFNEITYAFDPMRFGVEAYRHYLKKEHGDTFLLKVLAGNALTNSAHNLQY